MIAPRLDINLDAITRNTRTLVNRLAPLGITVTGVAKAALGSPQVASAMICGGAGGMGDSRLENLARYRDAALPVPMTLIRSPMLSQVDAVVREADCSLNTEPIILDALSAAAARRRTVHDVVIMVELGDLREGVPTDQVTDLANTVTRRPGLRLAGLGTNLACRSGVVPDQLKMDQLSRLVEDVEARTGHVLGIVSGGNSANLEWALSTSDPGRINDLRLGESILLGTEPLHRRPIEGLITDAFILTAEVIEVCTKPAQPWGRTAQSAFGHSAAHARKGTGTGTGTVRQAIIALGRQDVDPEGLSCPEGMAVLAASSDHLVLNIGEQDLSVGDEVSFGLNYSALLRAATSPFVRSNERALRDITSVRSGPASGTTTASTARAS